MFWVSSRRHIEIHTHTHTSLTTFSGVDGGRQTLPVEGPCRAGVWGEDGLDAMLLKNTHTYVT